MLPLLPEITVFNAFLRSWRTSGKRLKQSSFQIMRLKGQRHGKWYVQVQDINSAHFIRSPTRITCARHMWLSTMILIVHHKFHVPPRALPTTAITLFHAVILMDSLLQTSLRVPSQAYGIDIISDPRQKRKRLSATYDLRSSA